MSSPWDLYEGASAVVACAGHAGHDLRPEVAALMALDEATRLREEDPYTDGWTTLSPTRVAVRRSRFEVDLNRSRKKAVYREPADAWGLSCWTAPLPGAVVARSLALHDEFYAELEGVLRRTRARFGPFVVYDLHSYNHRREGPEHSPADPAANPEVNVGTGRLDHDHFGRVAKRFMTDLSDHGLDGRPLDVRENVRFTGGYLARWVNETFTGSGCALAIDVKKFFMDECTGDLHRPVFEAVGRALAATVAGVGEELARC